MLRAPHSIRKQTVELAVASEALALLLQPRMGDVNRRHFLPVIRRVLEEFDVPGRQIKIDRLEIDLGRLPLERFEEAAAERLYRELSRALKEVLRDADAGRERAGSRSQPESASRLESLGQYLLRGTLPTWAARAAASPVEALVSELAEEEPEALVALVRRLGRQARVLERIVLSFGEPLLRRLLRLLEPEHAALLLVYMTDLRGVHADEPVLPIGEGPFRHLAWLLVLAYLVRDPGSQFNRRSFVKSLLEGMAESGGLSYVEMTLTLRQALRKAGHRRSLKSSLPAVIEELVRELDAQAPGRKGAAASDTVTTTAHASVTAGASATTSASATASPSVSVTASGSIPSPPGAGGALASLEHYLLAGETAAPRAQTFEGTGRRPDAGGRVGLDEVAELRGLLRLLAASEAARAAHLIRRVARLPTPGRALVVERLLAAFAADELLALLMPAHSRDCFTFVAILGGIRLGGAASAPAAREGALLRVLLEAILCEPEGRPSLTAVVRRAFETWAQRLGVSTSTLAQALARARGLTQAAAGGALARALKEIAESFPPLRPHEGRGEASRARSLFARYDLLEVLRYYVEHGMLPWGALLRDPALTVESAAASLPTLSRPMLRRLFAGESRALRVRSILRVVEAMPEGGVAELLLRLFPRAGGDASTFLSTVPAFASVCGDRHAFYARLIACILDGRDLDLEELSAHGPAPEPAAELLLPANPDDWDAHLLKSAVAHRLRFGEGAVAGGHALADLLRALVLGHPEEARHFLGAVARARRLRAAFARQCPPALFDRVLRLWSPNAAETLDALARGCARIPAPYRTTADEDVRRLLLEEALSARGGELLTPSFFERILRRLFPTPLSAQVFEALEREAAAWRSRVELPTEHAAAFEGAVRTAACGGDARAGESGADEVQHVAPTRGAHPTRAAVFAFLLGVGRAPHDAEVEGHAPEAPRRETPTPDALLHELNLLLEESPAEVYDFISQHLADALRRETWVRLLPETTLVRVSYLLEPRHHRALLDAAEVLGSAWSESAPPGHPALAGRELFWSFLLEFLAGNAEVGRSTERLVAAFFAFYAARYLTAAPGAPDIAAVGARVLETAMRRARAGGHAGLLSLLQRDSALLLTRWESSATSPRAAAAFASPAARRPRDAGSRAPGARRSRTRTAFGMAYDEEEAAAGETIYVDNAGLVLTGHFLPPFFQSLDLLGTDERGVPRLRDRWRASRAVHLLQFLVDGRASAPEPLLVLNKILCGLPTGAPIESEIEMTEPERAACERLLRSVIANWKIIENTSVAGLQETFLRREGRLERVESGWELRVQRKTLDVLVDQIPWSTSVVYHRWMPQPLYVKW